MRIDAPALSPGPTPAKRVERHRWNRTGDAHDINRRRSARRRHDEVVDVIAGDVAGGDNIPDTGRGDRLVRGGRPPARSSVVWLGNAAPLMI